MQAAKGHVLGQLHPLPVGSTPRGQTSVLLRWVFSSSPPAPGSHPSAAALLGVVGHELILYK